MPRLKILVVDDREEMSSWLRRSIASTEIAAIIDQVLDVPEAVSAIPRFRPHVAILDLRLPSGSGLGLIQQVKKQLPDTTVIMFTGDVDSRTARTARELGADYFFHKGADFDKLVETLTGLASQPAESCK